MKDLSYTTTVRNPSVQDIGRGLQHVRHQLGVIEFQVRTQGWGNLYPEYCRLEREEKDLRTIYSLMKGAK